MTAPIIKALARLPFIELFYARKLNVDFGLEYDMWTSEYSIGKRKSKCLQISWTTRNGHNSGTVHIHDLNHCEVYFDDE